MTTDLLAPVYAADLRAITRRYLKPGAPVSDFPPPGGSFGNRISSYYRHLSPGSMSLDDSAPVTEAHARAYFEAAVGDRLFTIEPMLRLASLELDGEVRISIEERMLRILSERYDWLPFPFELIRLLQITVGEAPDHALVGYLDSAWHVISTSSTIGEAMRYRPELRIECLRMGASGSLTEFQTGLAELVTDLLLLVRAVREDLELAAISAGDHGGSVSLALQQRDAEANLVMEAVLPMLITHPVRSTDVERGEITSISKSGRGGCSTLTRGAGVQSTVLSSLTSRLRSKRIAYTISTDRCSRCSRGESRNLDNSSMVFCPSVTLRARLYGLTDSGSELSPPRAAILTGRYGTIHPTNTRSCALRAVAEGVF